MFERPRIYLDNAATSWPKPRSVYEAVDDYQRRLGAGAGRGGYPEADEVGRLVEQTRADLAALIGAERPESVVFTFNGTDSLNLAIHGSVRPGDHVIATVAEHNSVLRPLRWLLRRGHMTLSLIGCDAFGRVDPAEIRAAIRPHTRLIVVTHASNVTGAIQDVVAIGRIAREYGVLFLVDAAQTVGHLPFSVADVGADLLAAPGHKGLLGPLGTGFLYIRPGVDSLVDCVRQGGTGTASSEDEQPQTLPHKYESGNLNAGGIIGLGEGIRYVAGRGLADLLQHSARLTDQILEGLSALPGVTVHGPRRSDRQIGVVSFAIAGHDSPAIAKQLETFGVQVRAGFQCAARMHRALGTMDSRGSVRISIGPYTTAQEVDTAIDAISRIATRPASAGKPACACASGASAEPVSPELMAAGVTGGDDANPDAAFVAPAPGIARLWQETLGDPNVCIAILDGPVDLSHPCFAGADIQVHPSVMSQGAEPGAATAHGTHVASVIFGQHHSAVHGVAPRCRGLVLPIFRNGPEGQVIACSQIDLARAITLAVQYAEEQKYEALVINISGGQISVSGAAHPLLGEIMDQLDPRRHLVVAAAGNQGCACLQIPGAIPSVLAVGAMDADRNPLSFSNWGDAYQSTGLLAPGAEILGASGGGGTETRTGTSYATPIVSGVAALLLSLQWREDANVSAQRVRDTLLASAVGCDVEPVADCNRLLAGRLDVRQARLSLFRIGVPAMTDDLALNPSSVEPDTSSDFAAGAATGCAVVEAAPVAAPSRPAPTTSSGIRSAQSTPLILPAGCACGGGDGAAKTLPKVYAIGRLSYDFATRQRREYFRSQIEGGNPDNHAAMVARLKAIGPGKLAIMDGRNFANRADLNVLTWILTIDETPVYALAPVGVFPLDTHDTLVTFLEEQLPPAPESAEKPPRGVHGEGVPRIAIAGQIVGETRLYSGESVPIVALDARALANWTTKALVEAIRKISAKDVDARVETILDRLYELTRNLGIESRDRALNYAATNAPILQITLADDRNKAKFADMDLDSVDVRPSPFCRPDYDCWEVVFTFFDPDNLNRARRGFRYTIDVSDTLPQIVAGSQTSFSVR